VKICRQSQAKPFQSSSPTIATPVIQSDFGQRSVKVCQQSRAKPFQSSSPAIAHSVIQSDFVLRVGEGFVGIESEGSHNRQKSVKRFFASDQKYFA